MSPQKHVGIEDGFDFLECESARAATGEAALDEEAGEEKENRHVKAVDEGICEIDGGNDARPLVPPVAVHAALRGVPVDHEDDRDSLGYVGEVKAGRSCGLKGLRFHTYLWRIGLLLTSLLNRGNWANCVGYGRGLKVMLTCGRCDYPQM